MLEFFEALLKEVPMGCQETVLPDTLLKNHSVKCLIFEEIIQKPYKDNSYLFRALALHLHGNERLEDRTSKMFTTYSSKKLLELFLETLGVFVWKILQQWKIFLKQMISCTTLTL